MIKIIKEGKNKYRITCYKCGCEFEFEAEDVTWRTAWEYYGGHYPVADFFKIDCPWCRTSIDVKSVDGLLNEKSKMNRIKKG